MAEKAEFVLGANFGTPYTLADFLSPTFIGCNFCGAMRVAIGLRKMSSPTSVCRSDFKPIKFYFFYSVEKCGFLLAFEWVRKLPHLTLHFMEMKVGLPLGKSNNFQVLLSRVL
jgi:hypothetical protein